jgi:hypothetical protein
VSAVIVGAALTVINHGEELAAGRVDTGLAIRVGLTFVVPFLVSLISSTTALRDVPPRP